MNQDKTPMISIITCCFNSGQFLEETIQSVLNQSFQDFEYIFVDGGSTDDTIDIIESHKIADPQQRFSLYHQNTKGLMRARNIGLQQARGRYICFIDGDDKWFPHKLEKQLRHYEMHPELGLIFSNYVDIDASGAVIQGTGRTESPELTITGLFGHCYITNPSVMVKREIFEELGNFDEALYYSEDYDMWLRIIAKYPIGYIPDVLVQYRKHTSNMSTGSLKHYDYQVTVMRKIVEQVPALQSLLPKRLGSIYMVKARKQLKMLDTLGARESFRKAWEEYPARSVLYIVGIGMTYLSKPILQLFISKRK